MIVNDLKSIDQNASVEMAYDRGDRQKEIVGGSTGPKWTVKLKE